MKLNLSIVCVLCLAGYFTVRAQENSIPNKDAEKYIHAHPDISEANRKAIEAK
jgi:hypothetical protein